VNAVDPYLIPAAAALVALLVGFIIGRVSRRHRQRIEELEVRVAEREGQILQLESARTELRTRVAGAEQARDQAVEELSSYQTEVVSHFNQTSELLREMTLQYRTIYQHLAQGAEALCPEGALRIEDNAPIDGLPTPRIAGDDERPEGPELAGAEPELIPLEEQDDDLEPLELARRESPVQVDPRPEA